LYCQGPQCIKNFEKIGRGHSQGLPKIGTGRGSDYAVLKICLKSPGPSPEPTLNLRQIDACPISRNGNHYARQCWGLRRGQQRRASMFQWYHLFAGYGRTYYTW